MVKGQSTTPLGVCDYMQHQRCLSRRLRTVDLDDPPPGNPSDPQCVIQAYGARRYYAHLRTGGALSQPHNGTLPELAFYLQDSRIKRFFLAAGLDVDGFHRSLRLAFRNH